MIITHGIITSQNGVINIEGRATSKDMVLETSSLACINLVFVCLCESQKYFLLVDLVFYFTDVFAYVVVPVNMSGLLHYITFLKIRNFIIFAYLKAL